jgi:hypothetical protein
MANSNALLAVLVIIAIVVSVGGTLMTLSRIQPGVIQLTGAATPGVTTSGTLSISPQATLEINLTADTVAFGAGRVFGNCTTWTGSTQHTTDNTSCGNWSYAPLAPFTVENTGNLDVNVSIKAQFNASDAANWLGGTGANQSYNAEVTEAGSCTTLSGWAEFTTGDKYVCNNLTHPTGSDEIDVNINLTVPYDASTGALSQTITFTAETA